MRLIDADALKEELEARYRAARLWGDIAKNEEIKIRAEQAEITFLEVLVRLNKAPTIEC